MHFCQRQVFKRHWDVLLTFARQPNRSDFNSETLIIHLAEPPIESAFGRSKNVSGSHNHSASFMDKEVVGRTCACSKLLSNTTEED